MSSNPRRRRVDSAPSPTSPGNPTATSSHEQPTRSERSASVPTIGEADTDGGVLRITIGESTVHQSPPSVSAALRYLLAAADLPPALSFTSSIHGEGVTALSRSVAALVAHDWQRSTCWVDLNWWKTSRVHADEQAFPVTVADVLAGRAEVDDLAMPTSIPGLSMVGAGRLPVSARSVASKSDQLHELVDLLGRRFDHLIFDLPPVLASSDTITLAGLGEAYLLVVRQRVTTSALVAASLKAMSSVTCLGTVLNAHRSRLPRMFRPASEVWALGVSR